MNNAVEIIDMGFTCLVEKLGIVDAEAVAYVQNHPHKGKGIRV